jgi:membrane protease YdiL (CAAX protease family)
MKWLFRDKVSLGFRPAFQGNSRWYALSILIYPVTIALVLILGLLLGSTHLERFTATELLTAMGPAIIIYFLFAFFEEIGWRGYLTPKVAAINDGLPGYVLIGVVWASWHFPYMQQLWGHTAESLTTLLPRFVLGTVIMAVFYGEIRLRTGSVWPAVLMHGIGNVLSNTLFSSLNGEPFVTLVPGREWLGSFGIEGVLMIMLFALLGGILYLRRHHRVDTSKPHKFYSV